MTDASDDLTPDLARRRLVDRLTARGRITDPAVAAAFLTVPRHEFAPAGTDLSAAYADDVVVTRTDARGRASSSISAPWLQAYMLETARLRPGSRVLEIGSGGCNAALIAELVGASGAVTSIDIDPDVVAAARAALDRAGYPQVEVALADAEHGHPGAAPYDAVLVTVETSDIPPAWLEQLAPDGVLVAPVRMRGNTRCLTLRRHGDHLAATATLQCGFVPMQGEGNDPVRRVRLRGDDVVLVLDDATEVDGAALASALDRPRVEAWAPVTVDGDDCDAFQSLHLWLASQPRPYGALRVDRERTAGLLDPDNKFVCPTLLGSAGLAHLTMRRSAGAWQFGAHGFGAGAPALAAELVDLVAAWDRQHRHGPGPRITVHPAGTLPPAGEQLRLVVARRHTSIVVAWP
ncbi:methyltransferase, FxLD system [Actinoplanes sp. URMC 104]|uniref:methyltransferase, FxLD system n=1 Tax=Actinoplanes sp. URMC 104 TaxID=3423409 RepID=UPI003F194B7E